MKKIATIKNFFKKNFKGFMLDDIVIESILGKKILCIVTCHVLINV